MPHTPGPWTAAFSETGGYDCMTSAWHISAVVGGGWPAPIATVDLSHYGQSARHPNIPEMSYKKAEADARLIAAAPELLKALKGLLATPGVIDAAQRTIFGSVVYAAEDAIAKAKGPTGD